MNVDQVLIAALLAILLAVFAFDRFRIEVVALSGLAAGLLLGLVPPDRAFSGLASPAVVTVIEILLIVQVLRRSHLLDLLGEWLIRRFATPPAMIAALCVIGALVSTVMNNIGALALTLPAAYSLSRSAGLDLRATLMPLSFATLLGGICTLVGTPANLVVSATLAGATGAGFGFLDFAPTGIAVAAVGLGVVVLLAPRLFGAELQLRDSGREPGRLVTEVRVVRDLADIAALEATLQAEVHSASRNDRRLFPLRPDTALAAGDILLVEADDAALDAALAVGSLQFARAPGARGPGLAVAVMPQSTVVGSHVAGIADLADRGIAVLAVSTGNPRLEGGLDELRLGVGDILHLEGQPGPIRDAADETGMLLLAPAPHDERRRFSPFAVGAFGLGIVAAALGMPPELAFGGVVLVLAATGALDLRTGLAELPWPIVLLLVGMMPLGEAVAATGAAATFASALNGAFPTASPLVLCSLMLALAMAITPFVNNATTAVILGPIAVETARSAGIPPQGLLMAVAIGASCDFLTPFGHHNNTLAFGLGGYRFRDFPRLGLPLTLATLLVGTVVCTLVWT